MDGSLVALFESAKTIAVVGLSADPSRPSFPVANRLRHAGYEIIPVNPALTEWEGIKAYASIKDIPADKQIDIVDIFRKEEFIPEIVDEVLNRALRPKCVWLQQGLHSEQSRERCEKEHIFFVEDSCIAVQYGFYQSTIKKH